MLTYSEKNAYMSIASPMKGLGENSFFNPKFIAIADHRIYPFRTTIKGASLGLVPFQEKHEELIWNTILCCIIVPVYVFLSLNHRFRGYCCLIWEAEATPGAFPWVLLETLLVARMKCFRLLWLFVIICIECIFIIISS
jgi:hypothetical protein